MPPAIVAETTVAHVRRLGRGVLWLALWIGDRYWEVLVSDSARDTFIANIDPAFAPAVLELDRAVMAACAGLQSKISYQMLTYALAGDFRHWICAIDAGRPGRPASKRALHLRFLYGVLFDDPQGVLRAGTSTLRTIDFPLLEHIDTQLVTDYVKEAVSRLAEFKAQQGGR